MDFLPAWACYIPSLRLPLLLPANEFNWLTLSETPVSRLVYLRVVHKELCVVPVCDDETIAFLSVEPTHKPCLPLLLTNCTCFLCLNTRSSQLFGRRAETYALSFT